MKWSAAGELQERAQLLPGRTQDGFGTTLPQAARADSFVGPHNLRTRSRRSSRSRILQLLTLLFVLALLLPVGAQAAPSAAGAGAGAGTSTGAGTTAVASTYFSQTGYWVSDPFLSFWKTHGGLTTFGYPISRVFYQDGLLVQYFERARLERHDNLASTPYGVLATRLGALLTLDRKGEPAFLPVNAKTDNDCHFFSETGHRLCNGFRVYWEQHGGLAAFGYPISEEFTENGLTVQYFERARFEWHPEYRGTPYEYLLGQLGKEYLASRPAPANATTPENPDAPEPPAIGPQPLYNHSVTCGWNMFWYGDGTNPALNQHNLDMAKASGCSWIRIQAQWSALEPEQGQMNFLPLDPFIDAARADGLQVLVMVNHAPGWSFVDTPGVPASPSAFAAFMGALAGHFKGRVQAWQLWNEPNLTYEVGNLIDPAGYLALLRAASPRIRAADPDALIVLAGLAPTSLTDPKFAYSDSLYLEQLLGLNNGEVRNYIDVIGIHSYGAGNSPDTYFPSNLAQTPAWNNAPEFYFRHAEELHNIIVASGFGDLPIWITEFGWGTPNDSPSWGFCNWITDQDQTAYILRAFEIAQTEWPWVQQMFVWNLNYAEISGQGNPYTSYSLLDANGNPRPAYTAIQQMEEQEQQGEGQVAPSAGGG